MHCSPVKSSCTETDALYQVIVFVFFFISGVKQQNNCLTVWLWLCNHIVISSYEKKSSFATARLISWTCFSNSDELKKPDGGKTLTCAVVQRNQHLHKCDLDDWESKQATHFKSSNECEKLVALCDCRGSVFHVTDQYHSNGNILKIWHKKKKL